MLRPISKQGHLGKDDQYEYILKCIDSCVTLEQTYSCCNMIDNWFSVFNNEYLFDKMNISVGLKKIELKKIENAKH